MLGSDSTLNSTSSYFEAYTSVDIIAARVDTTLQECKRPFEDSRFGLASKTWWNSRLLELKRLT
jgi:hypothetical protein